jgi:hypothetical protein
MDLCLLWNYHRYQNKLDITSPRAEFANHQYVQGTRDVHALILDHAITGIQAVS